MAARQSRSSSHEAPGPEAHPVVASVAAEGREGRGEATPCARYGETIKGALEALRGLPGPCDPRAPSRSTLRRRGA